MLGLLEVQAALLEPVSNSKGPHFGSLYNKDHSIFGSILGPLSYGKSHFESPYNKDHK